VKCVHCGSEMALKQEYCPRCGQKAIIDFDVLAASVHEDAATRRGEQIEAWLRWVLLALVVMSSVVFSVNYLWDRPLAFDGSALPALPMKEGVRVDPVVSTPPIIDPRPNPPLPATTLKVFGYRRDPIRSKLRDANSRTDSPAAKTMKPIDSAISQGLAWLVRAQHPQEGYWRADVYNVNWEKWETAQHKWGEIGITSLALLAFLGEGETWVLDQAGKKSQYADAMLRAVKYLISNQDPSGRFGPGEGDGVNFMYNHGMATLAICEAAGLTGDEHLRECAQKAIDYIVTSQTPAGGWNYYAKPAGDSDSSVSSWQVQALCAAREAGLSVPQTALDKAKDMYIKATQADGRVAYSIQRDDGITYPSLRGIALMMRQMLGEDPRGVAVLKKMAGTLQTQLPLVKPAWGPSWAAHAQEKIDNDARAKYDPYTVYFNTYAMFMAGGKDWEVWNEAMRLAVPQMQDNDGGWKCNDIHTRKAGFAYSTALSILTLQVYYRIQ
jgi:hypothetical protein